MFRFQNELGPNWAVKKPLKLDKALEVDGAQHSSTLHTGRCFSCLAGGLDLSELNMCIQIWPQ